MTAWHEVTSRLKRSAESTFSSLGDVNARLVSAAFLPLTEWWRGELERFYARGVKRFVGRVGRGGVKSTTMVAVALNEAIAGS